MIDQLPPLESELEPVESEGRDAVIVFSDGSTTHPMDRALCRVWVEDNRFLRPHVLPVLIVSRKESRDGQE